jgi:Asparagine synthase (glutamine-hydrolyzing)
MCGICGHLRAGGLRAGDSEHLERVLERVRHRGPNQTGRWQGEKLALGHARLSILDLDPRAGQPMHDEKTGNVIVFNGEVYNFRALKAELAAQGERFRTTGDTEVLLALYRKHGQDCLKLLRGMYAFAIWDAARQELFLARDAVGKKPLVYFEGPSGLVFASEIRALRAHPDCPTAMDPGGPRPLPEPGLRALAQDHPGGRAQAAAGLLRHLFLPQRLPGWRCAATGKWISGTRSISRRPRPWTWPGTS